MGSIPDGYLDLFERRTFAHIAVVTADGRPHVTPVWIDYDGDDDRLLVNTERGRRKEVVVRHNPKVGVSMTDPDDPYRRVSVVGEVAAVTTEGAREHIDELSHRYRGEDYATPIRTERVILRIRPDEVIAEG